MITTVGVREFKDHATHAIRAVREQQAEYVITLNGEPVAILRPFTPDDARRLRQSRVDEALAGLDALAAQIGAAWVSSSTGAELVSKQRR